MSLSSAEIAAVVAELQALLVAGPLRVDEVRAAGERSLVLWLVGGSGPAQLFLGVEPGETRLHLVGRRRPAPAPPPAWQVALRRELRGARLLGIQARSDDRVVELPFSAGGGPLRLVAELAGRHGNLFLLDGDGRVRVALARDASARRLAPGAAYAAPPPRPAAAAGSEAERPARFPASAPGPHPVSAAIEIHYAAREAERLLEAARRRLREPLRAAAARARRALEKLAEEAARVPAAGEDRRIADLLKQNLPALRRGQRQALLTEWTDQGARPVTVALDPALSPRQNMERVYRRVRRIAESADRVAARTAEVGLRLRLLEALRTQLDGAPAEGLPRIEREARKLAAAPRPLPAEPPRGRRARQPERLPYRTFRSLAGVEILVGRGAADNDALTVRVARGNDAWLHARGRTGAHVVVRLLRGQGPDQETLLDAAHLAAWFSDARGAGAVDVAWTRAKHVRKARRSAPGAVTYSQDRTLILRPEAGRLERLLAAEEVR